jgi:hypothetical protein
MVMGCAMTQRCGDGLVVMGLILLMAISTTTNGVPGHSVHGREFNTIGYACDLAGYETIYVVRMVVPIEGPGGRRCWPGPLNLASWCRRLYARLSAGALVHVLVPTTALRRASSTATDR